MKIGLVIQGPIISGGFTGQTHGYGKTRASEKLLVKFDTNISIKDNVIEGTQYFDEIILSTWKNEIPNLTPELLSKVEVLGLDDPTPTPPSLRKPLKEFTDFHTINTVRQFYSTVEGLKHLSNKGVTHAIKIRTDQKIDMKLLHQEFTQFIRQKDRKFFVPFLVPNTPWTIPDFYIGGEINEFINISMAMTNSSVEIFGDGEQLRDFTYVGDVVRVITDSIENKASYESPINLAFNQKISVNEISRLLKKIIPDLQVKYLDNRKGDIRDSLSDGELINKIYPHIKPTNFEDNLVKTFEWIKINFIS